MRAPSTQLNRFHGKTTPGWSELSRFLSYKGRNGREGRRLSTCQWPIISIHHLLYNQTQWLLWCPGIRQMVPGQCPRLYCYTFQNCKHSQASWRTTCSPDGGSGGTDPWTLKPCVPSVLQTQEAESCPPSSLPSPRSACRSLFLRGSPQPQTTAETCSATSPTALWLKELAFCSLSLNRHKDTQEPSFT